MKLYDPGLTESAHANVPSLAHRVADEAYVELVYSNGNLIRSTTWTDVGMTVKVRETLFTYSGADITETTTTQYDALGVAYTTLTKTFGYTGANLSSVTLETP